jgi:hypothetical protein
MTGWYKIAQNVGVRRGALGGEALHSQVRPPAYLIGAIQLGPTGDVARLLKHFIGSAQ